MKVQLKKLSAIFCMSLLGLSSVAHAKWSISKKVGLVASPTLTEAGKTQTHFVQIFSSIDATKAEGMKNTLTMKGYPAFVSIKNQQLRPHYQVQIGPFKSRNLADSAKKRIIQQYPQFPFLNDSILKISFQQH